METNRTMLFVLISLIAGSFLLSSCGGDEKENTPGGTDTTFLSISINGGAEITFTGIDVNGAHYTTDVMPPYINANSTAIKFGSMSGPGGLLSFAGSVPGTYAIENTDGFLSYSLNATDFYQAYQVWETLGNIVISEFGAVGEAVSGTFSITDAQEFVDNNPTANLVPLTGSFSFVRLPDDTPL